MNAQSVISITTKESVSGSMNEKTPLIHKVFIVLSMITLMGGSLTGVMTLINVGYSVTFYADWLSSFLIAAVTVIPAGIMVMTLLTLLIGKLLPNAHEKVRNLVIGVSMAVVMESAMAFTTTLNNVGFENVPVFLSIWLNSFLAALPVALVLILIISVTIKPKIERLLKN